MLVEHLVMVSSTSVKYHFDLKGSSMLIGQATHMIGDPLRDLCFHSNPVFHARTKHIEVHYHYIRERILARDIDSQYIGTNEQVADILTRTLGLDKLRHSQ